MKSTKSKPLLRSWGAKSRAALLAPWAVGLALAALVVSPPAPLGAVIDDFNGAQSGWAGWNAPTAPSEPAALAELVNKRLRLTANFTTATSSENPIAHLGNVYYSRDLPVRQGQTLELRADLVSVSPDNLFGCLVTQDTNGGEYVLMRDRNEVALLKWSQEDGFSVAFWETQSTAYVNVVLVLTLKPEGDDLLIETAVFKLSTGETIFHRTVRDTPSSDWGVPDPLPHGWQVFKPDAGAPYKDDVKVVGLGMWHDTDGQQGASAVTFDNLEYRTVLPLQPHVIDDFEHGRKFMRWGTGGQCQWDIADGQLEVIPAQAGVYSAFIYYPIYELVEGQPIEFRLDLVSASTSDAWVLFNVGFAGQVRLKAPDRGYAMEVSHNRFVFWKGWDGINDIYSDTSLPSNTNPKTMSLTFTREGANLRIGAKVVLRDDPQQVLFSHVHVDGPGSETSSDPGPPPSGPVQTIIVGSGNTGSSRPSVVVDNLVCSQEPAPVLLGMRRTGATEATLAFCDGRVPLESESILGPWRPSLERVRLSDGEYICAIPLAGSDRYFRLVRGYHMFDSFEGGNSYHFEWGTASVVAGNTLRPAWNLDPTHSRGRIYGTAVRNADFTLRYGAGIWYRDGVGTVDILDWGDTMEDATFGILLRAKPDTELWYSNTPGLPEQRYAGLLTFKKADNLAESALSITGPGGAVLKEQRFAAVNPDKQYRLRFWAVGDQLTLELFDRDNLETAIQAITVADGRVPEGMDGLYGTKSAGGVYEVWIDQYVLSGATVY